jgi:glc operon protein GlcG
MQSRFTFRLIQERSMIARIVVTVLVISSFAIPAVSQTTPLIEKKSIGLAAAKKMVAAAEAEAIKNKWALSITVVDDGGNMVYFERMDGASLATIAISQGKARTAAQYRTATKGLEEGLTQGKMTMLTLPNAVNLRGALPVMIDGNLVGAIAGSGAKGEEDEQCAQAGIDALMK